MKRIVMIMMIGVFSIFAEDLNFKNYEILEYTKIEDKKEIQRQKELDKQVEKLGRQLEELENENKVDKNIKN